MDPTTLSSPFGEMSGPFSTSQGDDVFAPIFPAKVSSPTSSNRRKCKPLDRHSSTFSPSPSSEVSEYLRSRSPSPEPLFSSSSASRDGSSTPTFVDIGDDDLFSAGSTSPKRSRYHSPRIRCPSDTDSLHSEMTSTSNKPIPSLSPRLPDLRPRAHSPPSSPSSASSGSSIDHRLCELPRSLESKLRSVLNFRQNSGSGELLAPEFSSFDRLDEDSRFDFNGKTFSPLKFPKTGCLPVSSSREEQSVGSHSRVLSAPLGSRTSSSPSCEERIQYPYSPYSFELYKRVKVPYEMSDMFRNQSVPESSLAENKMNCV